MDRMGDVTQLLEQWGSGDRGALDSLIPIVYAELRKIAQAYLRQEREGHTLAPTALVHEAWIRLSKREHGNFANRHQFFSLAARMMRQILTDHARGLKAAKRGGGAARIEIAQIAAFSSNHASEFLALSDALDSLAKASPRQAQVIELRYFAGLNLDEIAELTGMSPSTISRDQQSAEAWLAQAMLE